MRLALCAVLAVLSLRATPAHAQAAMMSEPFRQGYSLGGYGFGRRLDFAYGEREGCDFREPAQRAIEACTRIAQSDVERRYRAGALMVRGDLYEDRKENDLADADYRTAVEIYDAEIADAPEVAIAYVERAAAYYRLDMFHEALGDLNRAIAMDSDDARAHYSRAITRFRLGDYAGAVADYDRTAELGRRMARRGSMQIAPDHSSGARLNPAIAAGRCIARAAAGIEPDVARAACRDAMRASGNTFARGFLNFAQGDYEAAWADFAAAVAEDETDGHALYGRGVSAIRLGRTTEGEADIESARAMEGDDLAFYANAGLRP